ncbi:succinylglutamate desuccinylase [Psychrobacillus glaciei]|uniref:Succinylglutamate desuccinylase n=1 Tax=Psychrobacillus glaciei TaxID=2283160 RepID=A0A5J6SJI3_9BACI|nr:M14 family metallopeptidase [Psychrobacillus glaciei]QFF98116.1 succinylglutamate desuccinylase [Psychrobacillus glaciei]
MWTINNLVVNRDDKISGFLHFPTLEHSIPAFMINGKEEGPSVLIMAGVHGCEYTSIDAALKLAKELTSNDIVGKLIILPIVNIASFYKRSIYVHPKDEKNLNRVFPGKEHGTESEKIAFWLHKEIFSHVDIVLDLHGGDMIEALVPFTIYQMSENLQLMDEAQKIASLFGIPYVVKSESQVMGSTYSAVNSLGKIGVIAEAGQQGILDEYSSKLLQDGTKNVLKYIGVLNGDFKEEPVKNLKTFEWYRASIQGLWYPAVEIGSEVKKGEILGQIKNVFGETETEIYAEVDGVVLFLVTSLAINVEDPLLALGD